MRRSRFENVQGCRDIVVQHFWPRCSRLNVCREMNDRIGSLESILPF